MRLISAISLINWNMVYSHITYFLSVEMITEIIMAPVMDETDGISPVPPGFVSLKSFTLQRVQESSLASTPASDPRKTMIDDENSATDVVKLRKSLRHRPWVNYCQFDNNSDEESDSELSDQVSSSIFSVFCLNL